MFPERECQSSSSGFANLSAMQRCPMLRYHYGSEEVAMLGARNSIATIAVKNLEVARVYYEEKLGLEVARELPEGISYRTGGTILLVYASRYAGTNQATCVTWAIDDVDRVAQELDARGVTFEHYDLPETTVEGDVHVEGERKAAWFKDPDGNILSVVNELME
jgi:catechol 2,3-dioxygenase-like lactoylglutathione lyase family enzyme